MTDEYFYKDPKALAKTLIILLLLGAVVDLAAVSSDLTQYGLLVSIRDGEEVTHEEAVASDSRQTTVGFMQLAVSLVTAVVFLVWVYRMSWNAHNTTNADLNITPGWAVGYFFIPVLNLWKPYQALREAYDAFAENAYEQKNNVIFPVWWFAWIATALCGRALANPSMKTEDLDGYINAASTSIGVDASHVSLDIMAVLLVTMVTNTCVRSFERSSIRHEQRVTPRPALYAP